MAAKAAKGARRSAYYTVTDGKAVLQRRSCPRCGTGVLLAEHKDRSSCGKCGYTEFKKK
jgi:small subunit ribosomal protein S27Ae